MLQQGQVFELTSTGVQGMPLWAYRYRVVGRDGTRVQRGGFASEETRAGRSSWRWSQHAVSLLDALARSSQHPRFVREEAFSRRASSASAASRPRELEALNPAGTDLTL